MIKLLYFDCDIAVPSPGGRSRSAAAACPRAWNRSRTKVTSRPANTSAQDVLIHHSDRGMQYLSIRCAKRLAEADIDMSVGSVGDSCDNPLAESVIGLFKTEVVKHLGPRETAGQVECETLKWAH